MPVVSPVLLLTSVNTTDRMLATSLNLFILTGRVNQAAFKGFAAGEVLFLGASGSKRGDGDWEITFNYAASPNVTNLPVGSITVASKKGGVPLHTMRQDLKRAPVLSAGRYDLVTVFRFLHRPLLPAIG